MRLGSRLLISAAFAAATVAAGLMPAHAAETLKIGVVATLEGPLSTLGEDAVRGIKTALKAVNNMAGGRPIEVIYASSDATPDSAVRAVRKLVEEDKVDIVVGPVSGDEGIAIKDYAKTQPNITFLNGQSGAQDTTYRSPAPNFFRFTADGAQQMAGLGSYIYDVKGYKKIATVGDDYSYPYTQEFGLVVEYCSAGGQVTQRFWPPLGTKDYSSIITALPDDVDAIFVALGGADAVNFVTQYVEAGGKAKIVDGDVVTPQGAEVCEAVERMRVTARATSMESRLMLILTGRYVGFLPRDFARAWAERGEIRAINMPGLGCGSTGYAIFRRDAAPNVARDLFLADLTRAFKPARPPVQEPKPVLNGRPKTVFQAEAGAA